MLPAASKSLVGVEQLEGIDALDPLGDRAPDEVQLSLPLFNKASVLASAMQ